MSDDIMQRVIRVIAETQRIPIDTVHSESTFEELKIDSLDGINILFALENEFNISIPDDAAKEVKSIKDLAAGIEKLQLQSGEAGA
jgi:acyl carrier protein